MNDDGTTKVLISALSAKVFPPELTNSVLLNMKAIELRGCSNLYDTAKAFCKPQLLRSLRLANAPPSQKIKTVSIERSSIVYDSQRIGRLEMLFKATLPSELQARLTIESAIERFLDYLLKVHHIVVLDESDRHVQVFIPGQKPVDFDALWSRFLEDVAFSAYGNTQLQMPGLAQTFITMLNSITLSPRGFSTLDVPVLTKHQASVMASWYFAVVQQVRQRQTDRQLQIDKLRVVLDEDELSGKERSSKEKEINDKEAMQLKEANKYRDNFEKIFGRFLDEQLEHWKEMKQVEIQLGASDISKKDAKKLQNKREKVLSKIVAPEDFVAESRLILREVDSDPFRFIDADIERHPERYKTIRDIAKRFQRKATEQINSTRGDIFTQCIIEMYRQVNRGDDFDPYPTSPLSRKPFLAEMRLPGDDSKSFCYACGVGIEPKTARWKVLRFMFERPSQRRQSSSSEGRPYICDSCAALAIASPLKVTDESIILHLDSKSDESAASPNTRDYVRMICNKEMHVSAGKYVILASDRTRSGDFAAQKLGQVQYALAKVASIFPLDVLADFKFQLVLQGENVVLANRHLLFVKCLMEAYGQPIIKLRKNTKSKEEINLDLGAAIRYVQQDLTYLADYSLMKDSSIADVLLLEETRRLYWDEIRGYMNSKSQLSQRARLYRDVAALTGLNYAFIESLERTAKKSEAQKKDSKYAAREVSKIIEKTNEAYVFGYYATLGDGDKTAVQARLYQKPQNAFIYAQLLELLEKLEIDGREEKSDTGSFIQLYIDDLQKAYEYFSNQSHYAYEKGWKDLTYNLKLSLYTRFPELVRKLKTAADK